MNSNVEFLTATDVKDNVDRTNYRDDIVFFIEKEMKKAEENRKKRFMSLSCAERLDEFIKMQGFPLTKYADYKNLPIKAEITELGKDSEKVATKTILEVIPGVRLYGILYRCADNPDAKRPFVIVQHGANDGPEIIGDLVNSANYNHIGKRLIARGINVFAPQYLTWEPSVYGSPYDRGKINSSLIQLGGSFSAFELLCGRRILDYFENRFFVDKQKIGYAGLSWGGMYALNMAALDGRLKVTLSSCFFNDRAEFNWSDWAHNDQANELFDAELAYMALPRYLCIECGKNDPLFLGKSALKEYERLCGYLKDDELKDHIFFNLFDGVHEFNPADDGLDWFVDKLIKETR